MYNNFRNKISWTGVFAGLAVGLLVFLATVNVGALITALLPLDLRGTGIMGTIWAILSVLLAAYVAGMVSMMTHNPEDRFVTVDDNDSTNEVETTLHKFRYDSKMNGLITGTLIALATTYFAVSGLTNLVAGTLKTVAATTAATTTAAAGTAVAANTNTVPTIESVQAYFNNISRDDIAKAIAAQTPGLSEKQVTAATNAIYAETRRVGAYVQNAPIYEMPAQISRGYEDLKNSLNGNLFRDKLIAENLTVEEANQVVAVGNAYTNQLQAKVDETIRNATELAKKAIITGALTWLLTTAAILWASVLGARSMAHTEDTIDTRKKYAGTTKHNNVHNNNVNVKYTEAHTNDHNYDADVHTTKVTTQEVKNTKKVRI